MPFSQRILQRIEPLKSWVKNPLEPQEYTVSMEVVAPGVVLEVYWGKNICWMEKSGIVSPVDKKILDILAEHVFGQIKISPMLHFNLREFDYYLRDTTSVPPWNEHFDLSLLSKSIDALNLIISQVTKGQAAAILAWVESKLATSGQKLMLEIAQGQDSIILISGDKLGALLVDPLLEKWQQEARLIFKNATLTLLYSCR